MAKKCALLIDPRLRLTYREHQEYLKMKARDEAIEIRKRLAKRP